MADLDDYLKTIKLYQWVAPDPRPKLITKEDYDRQFSRDLVGSWCNDDSMMPSPMTKYVVFEEGGTGYIAGAFFTAFSGKFEWREKGERNIEVRSVDEPEAWYPVRWGFADGSRVWVDLYDSEADDDDPSWPDSELIQELFCDRLRLNDRRAWDDSHRVEDTPSDAEEISVDGRTAWISRGDTYWKLHESQLVVTVANVHEDGQDQHFFTTIFIAPNSAKRTTGIFDHAPGHVDRERFLEAAARIVHAIRYAFGEPKS